MQKICPFSYCSFCCFSVGRKFRPGGRKFRPPEVPAYTLEYPALFFLPRFLAKSFSRFSLEGFRKFPRKFPGVRKFRSLVRNIRPKENLAKLFSRFLSSGGPELCTGGLLRKFPGNRQFRCKPRNIRPPAGSSGPFNPEFPALRISNG